MKNVVILGSTGSIGTSVLNIIRRNPDKFKVVGLVSNVNYDLLHAQAKEFSPEFVGLCSEKHAIEAEKKHGKFLTEVGEKASIIASSLKSADTVVCAIVGVAGMQSVYSAVKERKQILLANKESLVSGGEIIMNLAHKNDVEIIPLDSEHSAIWQCLAGGGRERSVINGAIPLSVDKIILTASGGAFFEKSKDELKKVTIKDATTHPNWSMGKKITVDSSTLMNKGLEIIEARWLFNTLNIDYVIHRESIIHGLVEYSDGTQIACLYPPNMEYPISTALFHPQREETPNSQFKFDKTLSFLPPDEETFILPKLAKECMKEGGTISTVLNSVNEAAVELFLNGKIGFLDIQKIVSNAVNLATNEKVNSIEQLLNIHNYWFNKTMNSV